MLPPLQADGDGEHDDDFAGVDIENTGVDELMAIMMMRWKKGDVNVIGQWS